LLEGSDDFLLSIHVERKYQTCYNQALYGAWLLPMYFPNVGTKLYFCGNSYTIAKSEMGVANIGLFILSHVFIPPKQSVALMPFFGPLYSLSDYFNIDK
jgi:hypothetical protein